MRLSICCAAAVLLSACASQTVVTSDPGRHTVETEKSVNKGFDEAWMELVSGLSKSFFVINNIEKASGIINVSFSSDEPSEFIDCGTAHGTISGAPFTYSIASPGKNPSVYQQGIYTFAGSSLRDTDVQGRVNIFMQKVSEDTTTVTVNAKYVFNLDAQHYSNAG